MNSPVSWYVKTKSGSSGPFSPTQLKGFANAGKLPPSAQISKSIDGPWVAAESVRGLFPTKEFAAEDLKASDLVPDSVKNTASAVSSAVTVAVSGMSRNIASRVAASLAPDRGGENASDQITALCRDGQDYELTARIHERVRGICTTGEEVLYFAIQSKPIANFSPDCVALTNKRFIIFRQKMLGRMTFFDCLWKDCKEVHLKENFLGAEVSFNSVSGRSESIDYLPKIQARSVYRIAQENEENAIKLRRDMKLEELRAEADKTVINHGVTAVSPRDDDIVSKMGKLKSLFAAGLITQEEFDHKKKQILDSI